jgi:hypothetical protein
MVYPNLKQGTIDQSIISQFDKTIERRTSDDITCTNNNDGTFTLNGTVENTELTFTIYADTMTAFLYEVGNNDYMFSLKTKTPTDTQYNPINFTVSTYNNTNKTSTDGTMYFTDSVAEIPKSLNLTFPVGTSFNNTTFYS